MEGHGPHCRLPLWCFHTGHVAEQVQRQVAELVSELVEQHVASVKAPLEALPLCQSYQW